MKKTGQYQKPTPISVEVNGESYSGSYTSRGGILRVDSPFGSGVIEDKTGNNDLWAKVRLRELVHKGLRESQ